MAEMLSPGVFVTEVDASAIVPTVSNSIAVFGGDFQKGPIDAYLLITNVEELIAYYGYPTNDNYNQWYQCYNFLQYGDKLLISRAGNYLGTSTVIDGCTFVSKSGDEVTVSNVTNLSVGNVITIGSFQNVYEITNIDVIDNVITLDRDIEEAPILENTINLWSQVMNGVVEATDSTNTMTSTVDGVTYNVPDSSVTNKYDYVKTLVPVLNASDFENKIDDIEFASGNSKLKIIARNPGTWSNDIQICIAKPESFEANSSTPSTFVKRYAFEGISLDDLFEYAPTGTEVGVIIKYGNEIVEVYRVDFNPLAKDHNNKSTYIETVINNNSLYVYVKDNTANANEIADYTRVFNSTTESYIGSTLTFNYSADSDVDIGDISLAYEIFNNKEELDVDIIIANEIDDGVAAKNLVDERKDCIAFIGSNYGDVVGQKSAVAISKLINWRKTGALNYNDMFVVACGNYKYQYDRYNDKYRWINIAGDIAGLRAQTNTNRASWWASAGLERGQIKNCIKLGFNPTQGQRDMLYKNGINPICTFPGQGTVMWGQKTLLDKPSSFDRVNVRGLFNTLERALSKMAKYQVMEFNDNFTRNKITSMIKPYLATVQAGRGIQDYLVICDESNNTGDIISRNQLIVDIYIKPTYVAEFILLRFTNAGTNSFAEVIGG